MLGQRYLKYIVISMMVLITSNHSLPRGIAQEMTKQETKMIIIAHRGASGLLPEHTLAAYQLAVEQGADFIEPDVVFTKDGIAVARHDVYLSGSTDVASHPEFADRKREFLGKTDWFIFDFTLAEVKSLRAVQPREGRSKDHDGLHTVLTLDEIIALVAEFAAVGRIVGIYPELKHPTAFAQAGINPAGVLLKAVDGLLQKYPNIPVYIQCFDHAYLAAMKKQTNYPLIALIDSARDDGGKALYSPAVPLDNVKQFAGVGINKLLLATAQGSPSNIVARAHALGLKVHVWTVRDDALPPMFATVEAELAAISSMGVDGVFTDFTQSAVALLHPEKLK